MKIEIESRESIISRAKSPFPKRTAIISISDVGDDSVVFENPPEYLLELKFDDVSYDDIEEALADNVDYSKRIAELNMITDKQADEIASFLLKMRDKAMMPRLLICQCEHGQSRSAGVAMAVQQFFTGDGIEIFADERYYPNKLVYKEALKALKHNRRKRIESIKTRDDLISAAFDGGLSDGSLDITLLFKEYVLVNEGNEHFEQVREWLSHNALGMIWLYPDTDEIQHAYSTHVPVPSNLLTLIVEWLALYDIKAWLDLEF